MRSDVFVDLRKVKDTTGQYNPDPRRDRGRCVPSARLSGHDHQPHTGNLGVGSDETAVVLADFGQIAVARDLAPSVKMLDQTFAQFDQQAIRVVAHYDAAPLNPEAVVILGSTGPCNTCLVEQA